MTDGDINGWSTFILTLSHSRARTEELILLTDSNIGKTIHLHPSPSRSLIYRLTFNSQRLSSPATDSISDCSVTGCGLTVVEPDLVLLSVTGDSIVPGLPPEMGESDIATAEEIFSRNYF